MLQMLIQAVLATLIVISPPAADRLTFKGWEESTEVRTARYESIAKDIAEVAVETCKDNKSCALTVASWLISVAWHESDFEPSVDAGKCYREGSYKVRCDGGRSHSMWQIRVNCTTGPYAPRNPDGTLARCEEAYTLDTDRKEAARRAWRAARRSMGACRKNDFNEKMAAYAGGTCLDATMRKRAREHYNLNAKVVAVLLREIARITKTSP